LLSNFAFNFKLRRYNKIGDLPMEMGELKEKKVRAIELEVWGVLRMRTHARPTLSRLLLLLHAPV